MQLTIVNASPRGRQGNTARILGALEEGIRSTGPHGVTVMPLSQIDSDARALEPFVGADVVMLAFPLYVYSLPSGAVRWLSRLGSRKEELKALTGGRTVTLAFLTQYGFPEACHARDCERQLKRACETLGFRYGGTIIRGGSEGFQTKPKVVQQKFLGDFRSLGVRFATGAGVLDQDVLDRFSAPEMGTTHWWNSLVTHLFVFVANRVFWGAQLKKNGVLREEAAQPYA